MDYPYLTDKERMEFLNKYGPNQANNITQKTVNNELNKLNFHIKSPAFSAKERNTLGFLISRYLWGHVISDIMQNKNVVTCFIDEAGVKKSPPKNSRGYISVAPVVMGEHTEHNIATILTAVVPGYGNFSRWFKGPVTHKEYSQFIREAAFIIRTKICKKDNQIFIINDNAGIHKEKCVLDVADENKVNLFFTVPYSPQTNLPAENYFSRMKSACIFEHFIVSDDEAETVLSHGFEVNDENEDIVVKQKGSINGTSFYYLTLQSLIQRWDYFNKVKYDSKASLNIFFEYRNSFK